MAGLIVGMVIMAVLPAAAGEGDPLILGDKNVSVRVTRLNTRGGLRIDNFKPGNPALILNVADPAGAPMTVNATGLVDNLNADMLDGLEAVAFAIAGHDHAWSDLTSGVPSGLDDGDDDTIAGLLCDPGQVAKWNTGGTAWECADDVDTDTDTTLTDGEVLAAVLAQDGGGSGLDADLLDGFHAVAFALAGHDHDTDYLAIDGTAADSDLLDGRMPTAHFRIYPAGPDGLPILGATCLLHGGYLVGIGLDGSPHCGPAMGPGTFADSGQEELAWYDASYDVALGDLDGDGDLDAFVVNYGAANLVLLNDGRGYLTDSGQALGSDDSLAAALGDVDADGDLDAVVGNAGDQNRLYRNDGTGTFTDSGQTLGTSQSHGVALGDLDGDSDLDILFSNLYSAASHVWLNDGTGTFTDSQSIASGNSYDIALGDLDGDGDLDAFFSNSQQANAIWENDGTGLLSDTLQALGDATRYSYGVELGDLDGDGDIDAFVADSQGADRVWKNNGSGTFSETQAVGTSHSYGLAIGDVDGDGDLDAFVGDEYGDNLLWLNNGSGTFSDSGQTLEGPEGSWTNRTVALGDLNADGDLDAVIVNDMWWSTVWFNE